MIDAFAFLLLLTFCSACFSEFFEFCLQKGNVLRWYKYYTTCYFHFKPRKRIKKVIINNAYYIESVEKQKWYAWFYKMSSGCIRCYGTWHFFAFYLVITIFIFDYTLLQIVVYLFLGAGLNYIWQLVIERHFI